MKKPLSKVYDPIERIQHIAPPPCADQVTLCGETDWIGRRQDQKPKYDTKDPVNCNLCRWIFDYCNGGTWPK